MVLMYGAYMSPPVISPAGMHGAATFLRCGGCGDSVLLTHGKRHYGQLVHGFLGGHELCLSAVEITRSPAA
jgi:hypothetical protein